MELENEQNSTPEETSGASLRDALMEAFDEAESAATGEQAEPEEVEEAEQPEDVEAADEAEEADEEDEKPAPEGLKAPEHWSASDRETFNTLSALGDSGVKAQQFLERRHKEMERAANEKFQEAAAVRKKGEAIDAVLGDVKTEWAVRGIDEVTGIRSLITTYQQLGQDPVNTLRHLAQQLNVDLSQLAQSDDDPFADPVQKRLLAEVQELKAQLAGQQAQRAQTEQLSAAQRQIQEFEGERDASGALKHPHFAQVYDHMVKLVGAGLASDLPSAYDHAVKLAGLPAQPAQAQAGKPDTTVADRIAKAKKAQKAAVGLRSGAASTQQAMKPKSLRDEIAQNFEKFYK